MILSFVATAFAVIGILLTLLTALTLGFYFGSVPNGSNAVGLVVPFFAAIGAGLAGVVAGTLVVARGSLDGLGFSRQASLALIVGASVLVGASIVGAFLAWSEKHRLNHPGLLTLSGVVLPLGYFGFVLLLAWSDPATVRSSMLARGLGAMTGVAVLSGLATTGLLAQAQLRKSARATAYATERQQTAKKEEDRRTALTPEQKLLEDLSKYSATAPLWSLIAGLLTEKNPSLRAIWIQRARQVPDFEQQLQQTIAGQYGIYRHGCAAFIVEAPEAAVRREAWAGLLAQDAQLTAEDIRKFGDLAAHDNDHLGQHVLTIARAAMRLERTDELVAALRQLREVAAKVATNPTHQDSLQALNAALEQEKVR